MEVKIKELIEFIFEPKLKLIEDSDEKEKILDAWIKYSLRILSSRMTPSSRGNLQEDEFHQGQVMLKRVAKNSEQNGLALRELLLRLGQKKNLKQRWAILYFLNRISGSSQLTYPSSLQKLPSSTVSTSRQVQKSDPLPELTTIPRSIPTVHVSAVACRKIEFEGQILTESALLRDVLFVMQGLNGKYLSFSKSGTFMMHDKLVLSKPIKDLVLRLCEIGWLFRHLLETVGLAQGSVAKSTGLMHQSLFAVMREEISEYYLAVAVFESQLHESNSDRLTLFRLLASSQDLTLKMKWLNLVCDSLAQQKGGVLLSTVASFLHHGSAFVRKLAEKLLQNICKPLFHMIECWMFDGELQDPFHEFFVADDHSVPQNRLWHDKYSLNLEMIPSFLSVSLAQKILQIGKAVNFLAINCKESEWIVTHFSKSRKTFENVSHDNLSELCSIVTQAGAIVNKYLVALLFSKYKFFSHCEGLKRYLLLGQGDFISYLMDLLENDLDKPASTVFKYNLNRILDSAIRGSNSQYDDPDIINRLDICAIDENTENLVGWDVFALNYHLDSPIDGIFSDSVMNTYLRLFNLLWRVKRVEHSLSRVWKSAAVLVRSQKKTVKSSSVSEHAMASEMIHFVRNLQYYLTFEVVECSWQEFAQQLKTADDLDQILIAHQSYLSEISKKAMLASPEPLKLLTRLLDLILEFCRAPITFNGRSDYINQIKTLFLVLKKDQNTQFFRARCDFNFFYASK